MREIKFRAWDLDYKRWQYGYYEEVPAGFGEPTGIMHTFNDWNLNGHFYVDPKTVGQYIGFKDKNDREIYEGDLLQYISRGGHGVIIKISCNAESCRFEGVNIYNTRICYCTKNELKHYELIGNIYENKYLLK